MSLIMKKDSAQETKEIFAVAKRKTRTIKEQELYLATTLYTIKETIVNQVLLVEGVIIGNIPDTYYNLEGLSGDQSMEMID